MHHRRAPFPLTVLALLATAGGAAAQQLGELHRMYDGTDTTTFSVQLADLDGDGDLDLYEGPQASGGNTHRVFLWSDDGGFAELSGATDYSGTANEVALGDVDGDGDADVVIAQNNANVLYRNDGAGQMTLDPGALPVVNESSLCVELGDLDQDGDLDVVFGELGDPNRIHANDGSGDFTDIASPFAALDVTNDVELADLDGDGLLDILTANGTIFSDLNRLYINGGALSFTLKAGAFGGVQSWTNEVATGDLDGDLDLDVVFGKNGFGGGGANALWLNDGVANFTEGFIPGFLPTRDIELVDVDGDDDLDVVDMGENSGNAHVLLLNDGAGGLTDASSKLGAGFDTAWNMAAGDIDQDGDPDLVFGINQANRLLLNDGDGNFTDVSDPFAFDRDSTEVLALADVDGDGDLDAFQGNSFGDEDRLLLNPGSGVFAEGPGALPTVASTDCEDALFGDWDGDGDQDLMVLNLGKNRAYRNDGTGAFSYSASDTPSDLLDTYDADAGDIDGDGDPDLVIGNDLFWTQIYLNDGTGDFSATQNGLPQDALPARSVAFGDLDADGDLEIVRAFRSSKRDEAYINNGAGTFALGPMLTDSTTFSYCAVAFDADNDGDADVLLGKTAADDLRLSNAPAGFTAGTMPSPLFSWSTEFAVADLNDDGLDDVVAAADAFMSSNIVYRNEGGGVFSDATLTYIPQTEFDESLAVAVADLDGDGALDVLFGNDGRDRALFDLRRQVAWRGLPRVGKPLTLDLYGAAGESWLLALSFGTASIPLPNGTLLIDPTSLLVVDSGLLDGAGRGSATVPIADVPAFVGLTFYWQAALGALFELSNLELTTLSNL
ncbi:MAG: VCBS repeat-containing protein [Planctomycetota bacterium]